MSGIRFSSHRIKFKISKVGKRQRWLQQIAELENCKILDLRIIFCSDNHLLKINQQYLNHNTFTDIITFDYCPPKPQNSPKLLMGDIFISISRVKENAKIFNTTFENELNRVLAHGVLHLCGYKDKTINQEKLMREKENEYLNLLIM